jgi:hypothetical protein
MVERAERREESAGGPAGGTLILPDALAGRAGRQQRFNHLHATSITGEVGHLQSNLKKRQKYFWRVAGGGKCLAINEFGNDRASGKRCFGGSVDR